MIEEYTVIFKCDWTDEHGDVCPTTEEFPGEGGKQRARDKGWGAYSNAFIRRDRWTQGAELWFCPVHASVFGANHGWGHLESYEPPTRWWHKIWRPKS